MLALVLTGLARIPCETGLIHVAPLPVGFETLPTQLTDLASTNYSSRRRLQSDLQEGFFNRISSRDAAERRGALLARTTGVSRTIGDAALDGVAQFDGEFTGLKVFGPDWFSLF